MLKRIVVPVLVAAVAFLVSPGNSQVQTGDPAQDAMIQQLQQMGAQMQQNMQQQGIDPQQFADQMRQQVQGGSFDPEQLQQQLIDSGIISQDMMTRLQGTVQQLALTAIRRQLASSDEEWAILQPKMQRIVAAIADVGQPGPNFQGSSFGLRMMVGGQANATPVAVAMKDLQATVDDPNSTTDQLSRKITTWRTAHEAAKIELGASRDDMRNLLTLRQEGILLGIGVLD